MRHGVSFAAAAAVDPSPSEFRGVTRNCPTEDFSLLGLSAGFAGPRLLRPDMLGSKGQETLPVVVFLDHQWKGSRYCPRVFICFCCGFEYQVASHASRLCHGLRLKYKAVYNLLRQNQNSVLLALHDENATSFAKVQNPTSSLNLQHSFDVG